MLASLQIVRASAKRIAEAAHGVALEGRAVAEALSDRRIEQEPAATDRLLGRIEARMQGFEISGLRWTAKTFTDRGCRAQETRVGADFMGVLEITIPSFTLRKGFLAQAKLIEPNQYFPRNEHTRLADQCHKMLEISRSSYVFLYSIAGVFVVPAQSVVSAGFAHPHQLYRKTLYSFFLNHFESFIGDARLFEPSMTAVEELLRAAGARKGILLGLAPA